MRKWLAAPGAEAQPAAIWALCALMAATFCVVTTEHLPAGLLPQISSGLGVSLSAAGQLVTGYALTVMLLTVPLTYATRRIPRRPLLLGLMTVFVLAGMGSAVAPNYALLLVSRAVTALVHAVFWAVVTVTAMGLFPRRCGAGYSPWCTGPPRWRRSWACPPEAGSASTRGGAWRS